MDQKVKRNLIHKMKSKVKVKTGNTLLKRMNSNFQNLFQLEQAQLHQDH